MEALGGEEYSSYSFTISALDGVSYQRHAPAALYPKEWTLQYPLYRKLIWTQRLQEKLFASAGDRIPVVQSLVILY
jgi:hypothetical protein